MDIISLRLLIRLPRLPFLLFGVLSELFKNVLYNSSELVYLFTIGKFIALFGSCT
jgi:hypothetical protein